MNRSPTLAESIVDATADLDVEVVACERVGLAGEMLEASAGADVLIMGPSMASKAGLGWAEHLGEQAPHAVTVLAFSDRPEASIRDIIRAGAVDLVQLPATEEVLVDALLRALDIAANRRHPEAHATPAPTGKVGRVITVTSATGGCGKTFYATNLAYFLATHTTDRVCVVDLDLQFGEMATALHLKPKYTIYDAVSEGTTDVALADQIDEFLVRHESGIHLLAAPRLPEEADAVDPHDVTRVIDAVRHRFDHVIVDTPTALSEVVLAAMDLTDILYVLGTLDLPSVRNMSVFQGTLEKLKVPQDNIRLLMNKAEEDVGIDLDQVQRLFPKEFETVLPYDREVSRSVNIGLPVLGSAPDAVISRRLAKSLETLLPDDLRTATAPDDSDSAKRKRRLMNR